MGLGIHFQFFFLLSKLFQSLGNSTTFRTQLPVDSFRLRNFHNRFAFFPRLGKCNKSERTSEQRQTEDQKIRRSTFKLSRSSFSTRCKLFIHFYKEWPKNVDIVHPNFDRWPGKWNSFERGGISPSANSDEIERKRTVDFISQPTLNIGRSLQLRGFPLKLASTLIRRHVSWSVDFSAWLQQRQIRRGKESCTAQQPADSLKCWIRAERIWQNGWKSEATPRSTNKDIYFRP